MAEAAAPRRLRVFGQTERKDAWWVAPLVTFVILTAFVVYMTWAGMQGDHYAYGPYLSPLYSPELWGNSHHAFFGPPPLWIPSWFPFSPAMLIVPFPVGFRLTCYYYRGAYYKAFWADPPACTVGEPRKSYLGEQKLPLIIQNVHRYFLYGALALIVCLAYDAWKSFWFPTGFGIGIGSLVLTLNVTMLGLYTFSCHSLRHLVGGSRDKLPTGAFGACYTYVSGLNRRHMQLAWASLIVVASADIYVRLCSMGIIHDYRLIG